MKKGKTFNLSHVLKYGIPQHWFHGEFQVFHVQASAGDSMKILDRKNKVGAMNVKINMADHSGTHIDALNHTSIDGMMFNGVSAEEVTGDLRDHGKPGIEKTPPIFARGVLLDIARSKRKAVLDPGYVITSSDVESIVKKQGIDLSGRRATPCSSGQDGADIG